MRDQHMDPAEAVAAGLLLGADRMLGHHWGTFQLTDEGIAEPVAALAAACAEQGLAPERFEAFRPGQVWEG
jgi:L-ascorbate metabolism protein UlaG (beta-lactamase superfamily)